MKDNYNSKKSNEIDDEPITDDAGNNTFTESYYEESFQNNLSLIVRKPNRIYDNYKSRKNNNDNEEVAVIANAGNNTTESYPVESS